MAGGTKGESESYLHPRGRCSHEVQERARSEERPVAGRGKREDPGSRERERGRM